MKLILTLVHMSQAMRSLADKARRKAIKSIQSGLIEVDAELEDIEARRSQHMVEAHNSFYAEKDKLDAQLQAAIRKAQERHLAKCSKLTYGFSERRKMIALVSKGAVTELMKVRSCLRRELDNLTK